MRPAALHVLRDAERRRRALAAFAIADLAHLGAELPLPALREALEVELDCDVANTLRGVLEMLGEPAEVCS